MLLLAVLINNVLIFLKSMNLFSVTQKKKKKILPDDKELLLLLEY